ncbi:MAG: hypothetical protein BECKG1743F_GA0114225_103291, partial [Candidatus Kentron sp. G]
LLHNILRLIVFILLPIWEIIIRLPWLLYLFLTHVQYHEYHLHSLTFQ